MHRRIERYLADCLRVKESGSKTTHWAGVHGERDRASHDKPRCSLAAHSLVPACIARPRICPDGHGASE